MKTNIIQFPKQRVSDPFMLEKHLDNLLSKYKPYEIIQMLKFCMLKLNAQSNPEQASTSQSLTKSNNN